MYIYTLYMRMCRSRCDLRADGYLYHRSASLPLKARAMETPSGELTQKQDRTGMEGEIENRESKEGEGDMEKEGEMEKGRG